MTRYFARKNKAQIGSAPGSFVFQGDKKMEKPLIRIIDFEPSHIKEETLSGIEQSYDYKDYETVSWLNIDGVHDAQLIEELGANINLNPLILEDVMNTYQRPKFEDHSDSLFCTLKMLKYSEETGRVDAEQLSIITTSTMVITFQERRGDVFEPVRERLRNKRKKIRNAGTDYLTYALIDTVIDNYIHIIGRLGDKIEELESIMIDSKGNSDVLDQINSYKREVNYLRKTIRPAWEAIGQLSKTDSELIQDDTKPYINDLYDHITHTFEATDYYRDLLSDLLNIYHTNLSSSLNDVMKVLTIFSVIFIPITFIAGIYGTNFKYVPELEYEYSYFVMWGLFVLITVSMLWYFKRKGWM